MKGMRLFPIAIAALSVIVPTAAQVDYATQIQPIFNANCIGCHGGTNGVTLSSYAEAIASVGVQYGVNIIQPGSAVSSPIVDKISNDQPLHGLRMPRGSAPLPAAQITLIRNWIDEGAREHPAATTVVAHRTGGVPDQFSLSQNYPNPFNPTTKITFALPVRQTVMLRIFDVLGHEISTLISGQLDAGTYRVEWNASGVPSGIYFYQLRTNDPAGGGGQTYVETKKLIVQK